MSLGNITIKLQKSDFSKRNNGIFQGWGTSLCWWANRLGYSPALTEKAAELFYGEAGLRLNIMRYNIGGGDDPTHKHIKRTDSMVPGWLKYNNITNEYVYDYTADINQLNVLKACYEKCNTDVYVEVFSNSPPYFMCKSGCSSGGADPDENNLRDDCYTAFAEYLAHVTEYINNTFGIRVNSLSPMNEPNTDYWHLNSEKQEGCHFDPGESQNRIITETAKALRSTGLSHIEIVASDETATDKAFTAYEQYTDEVKAVIDRISTHTYGTEKIKEFGDYMTEQGRNLWMSETDWGDVAGVNAGEMGAGLWLAKKVISDFSGLDPSAWVLWQTIDYHISRNGYMGNKDFGKPDINGGYWGLAFADHDTSEILLTQKYFCLGQFTRYIRPGDTIIHTGKSTLSALSHDGAVTVVAVNDTDKTTQLYIDASELKQAGTLQVIRTSGSMTEGERWKNCGSLDFCDPKITVTLKENSVTTFIIK